jgi:putative transcriptional regulator
MSPLHHPCDARLVDYAAGSLAHGQRLVLASHLFACPECAAKISLVEAVGGALLEALPPAAMREDALDLIMARIERPEPSAAPVVEAPAGWINVPPEVVLAARRATRRVAPGVWTASVAQGPGRSRTYLLGLKPGRGVPHHVHRGAEMVCVIKGAFADGEVVHRAGDFAESDEAVRHHPTVVGDEECVCLIATDRSIVGLDWLGRILIPLMGA